MVKDSGEKITFIGLVGSLKTAQKHLF